MTDLNHVVLIGRLTKDLGTDERSFGYNVSNNQARANVSIAVNRARKNGDQWIDEVNYFDVTIWGKTAENLKPYLTKGKQICVEGYLKQDRWEKDGQKFSKIVIVASNVQLLGGRSDGAGSSNDAPKFQPAQFQSNMSNNNYSNNYSQDSYGDSGMDISEDIPF
ncbi:MAG: single-stranded DNA-binding protein [Treponema sp.]|nr:single-stranded DNA-binding protein [Treponema sp.]